MTHDEKPAGPPVAPRVRSARVVHGDVFVDDYAWMRDRSDPRLLAYLEAENAWADAATASLRHLHGTLHAELVATLPPTDQSVSWSYGSSVYYTCTPEGRDYARHLRRPRVARCEPSDSAPPDPAAELLLDENVEAAGGDYFAVGDVEVSPDERLFAWTADRDGSERFSLRVRDLRAGVDLPDLVSPVYYGIAWEDGGSLLYTVPDDANRPWQVRRHRLGTAVSEDEVVIEEPDRRFELTVRRLRSGRFAAIRSASRDTAQVWLVPPGGDPPLSVLPRRAGTEYDVDDPGGPDLLVLTNDGAEDFRVLAVPLDGGGQGRDVVPGEPGTRFDQFAAFDGFAAVRARRDGGTVLRLVELGSGSTVEAVPPVPPEPRMPPEPLGVVGFGTNAEHDVGEVAVNVDGPLTPRRHFAVDLRTAEWRLRHTEPVPGFDPDRYVAERISATADDGTDVPITVVRHRDTPVDGTAACLVTGYGAYESSYDPEFDRAWLPLLDRGAVCAIAHVRGGGELGRRWWVDGHLLAKPNTFGDFIACTRRLVAAGYAAADRVAARGLSAGGLLMGAVFAMAPSLFRAVVAEAPFVDVVTTMLDDSIPLTAQEWDEWGDPRDPAAYWCLRRYSPYENLPAGPRPDLLVTAHLHDPRVLVHEPAKWVAALRASGEGHVLFRTDLGGAAHTGPSGRYTFLDYEAGVLAFLVDALALPRANSSAP